MKKLTLFAACAIAALCSCATTSQRLKAIAAPTGVPPALQVPSPQEPYLLVHAVGVQIYDCTPAAEAPHAWGWKFRSPEATLHDAADQVVGRHFAGPSWASSDGSAIVGQVVANVPAPANGDIPWLRLDVKAHQGAGVLLDATSVQRIETAGGVTPSAPCDASNANHVERVGYTATYVFWRLRTV